MLITLIKIARIKLFFQKVAIINTTILHRKTNNRTWFRVRSSNPTALKKELLAQGLSFDLNEISDSVCEIVYQTSEPKTAGKSIEKCTYNRFSPILENSEHVQHIIFFSNCKDFCKFEEKNPNAVYSNIFKFYYCTSLNTVDVTYTMQHLETVVHQQINCAILYIQQNFNTNASEILQPLSLLSSEKNTSSLLASIGKIHSTGSPRDNYLLGSGTSLGGINKMDLRIEFDVDMLSAKATPIKNILYT
jgi:hypothetical protein